MMIMSSRMRRLMGRHAHNKRTPATGGGSSVKAGGSSRQTADRVRIRLN
jgi:hypothetical protein